MDRTIRVAENVAAQRRYRWTIRLLSYLSAASCGLSLFLFAGIFTAISGHTLYDELFSRDNFGELIGSSIPGIMVTLALGAACGRFLVRALPPPMLEHPGGGRSAALVLCALALIAFYCFAVLLGSFFQITDRSSADERAKEFAGTIAMSLPFAVLWASTAIGLLIGHYRKRRAVLDRPFVLFLRRFSTFSDRTIVALIMRQAAYDVPVVFLTPTRSRPGDWDPFLVGFAGFKFRHPWRSAPIVIRARDEAWQETAFELICRARTILFDISEKSSALRTETEMLDKAGRWPDTVCLRLLVPGEDPVGGYSGVHTIDYTKSWVRALPRMAIGLLLVLFAAPLLLVFLPAFAAPIVAVAAVSYYYSCFVRPSINRAAKKALKSVLRAGSARAHFWHIRTRLFRPK